MWKPNAIDRRTLESAAKALDRFFACMQSLNPETAAVVVEELHEYDLADDANSGAQIVRQIASHKRSRKHVENEAVRICKSWFPLPPKCHN